MNIVIIGGGAAGMTAAISASLTNKKNKIIIIEHADRVGKKILSTGNGKCNLTNEKMSSEYFRSDDNIVVEKVLGKFGYRETIDFFTDLGLVFKNRDGYIYPNSGQASSVLDALRYKCYSLGVEIRTGCEPVKIECGSFYNITVKDTSGKKISLKADRLIIATGSKASNLSTADGSGYSLAKNLGHTIIKPLPALTGLKCSDTFCKSLSGVRCDATVNLYVDDSFVASDTGELQLTDYGISGIPVFQISRYAIRAVNAHRKVFADIDFMPNFSEKELGEILARKFKLNSEQSMEQQLSGLINKKIASVIAKICDNDIKKIIRVIKKFRFNITGCNSYEQSQICTGGIKISEINFPEMESAIHKNLYFAGEIIDVDGICGGYNLQWAWATGYLAGRSAS